jgi:serine/threonine-protein kinase
MFVLAIWIRLRYREVGFTMARATVFERIGEYRIEKLLVRTATSIEYLGEHLVLPRRAVLKVLAPNMPPLSVLREACMLEALHHPGVVRVYESGLLPDRRPWFARELVEGTLVSSSLAPGAIDQMDVIPLLRDIAEVLGHAHYRGIVHANLRPDKIMLTGRVRGYPVCITDWSDARAHDASSAPQPPTAASWYYAAPEVAAGDGLDDRADVFSLGVIAYRLLTGVLPFEGLSTAADGSTQHPPTELRCSDAPRELTTMVDQMLAHDPWDRPSASEVHQDLTWLCEALAVPPRSLRIRRPRWTPSLDFTPFDRQRDPDLEVDPIVEPDE